MRRWISVFAACCLMAGCASTAANTPPDKIGPKVQEAEKAIKLCIMKETYGFLNATGDLFQSAQAGVEQCKVLEDGVAKALSDEGRNPYMINGYMSALRDDNIAFAKWFARGVLDGSINPDQPK